MLTKEKLEEYNNSPYNKYKLLGVMFYQFRGNSTIEQLMSIMGLTRNQVSEIVKRSPYLKRNKEIVLLDRAQRDSTVLITYIKDQLTDIENNSQLIGTLLYRTRKRLSYETFLYYADLQNTPRITRDAFYTLHSRMIRALGTIDIIIEY